MVLDSKKVEYSVVDISSSEDSKKKMREIAADPKALPPQIANGDQYCGVSTIRKNIFFDKAKASKAKNSYCSPIEKILHLRINVNY